MKKNAVLGYGAKVIECANNLQAREDTANKVRLSIECILFYIILSYFLLCSCRSCKKLEQLLFIPMITKYDAKKIQNSFYLISKSVCYRRSGYSRIRIISRNS